MASYLLIKPPNQSVLSLIGGHGVAQGNGTVLNVDFQNTPAFLALRSTQPLYQAIREGLQQGLRNPQIARDMGGEASDFQMAIWMKELTEITLMDFIFSQQDRVGNIDYKWELYTYDAAKGVVDSQSIDSKVARAAMKSIALPLVPTGVTAYLVQRSHISDNDAGGRVQYANFTKRTTMLQKIRHLNLETYRKLLALADDLNRHGDLYNYFKSNFTLDDGQVAQIVNNTNEAANIYKATCHSGQLRFDLYHAKALLNGSAKEVTADCDHP